MSSDPSYDDTPASPKPAAAPGAAFLLDSNKPSVISEGFSLVGDITATGVLHVEGTIKGTINTEVVNIGPKGTVDGRIKCNSLQIKGAFTGTADCQELFIAGKAKVAGKITYQTLSVHRGAQVEGDLTNAR